MYLGPCCFRRLFLLYINKSFDFISLRAVKQMSETRLRFVSVEAVTILIWWDEL
jgi:hypothetical protein